MPRLSLHWQPLPPDRRGRQAAAAGLALAVLVAHWAVLRAAPPPPAVAPGAVAMALRVQMLAPVPAPAGPQPEAATAQALDGPAQHPSPPAARAPGPSPEPRPQPTPPEPPPTPAALAEPAQAEARSAALPASAPPWPIYAARLPPPATRHYLLRRGERTSPVRLAWSHDAQGYELALMAEGGDLDGLGAASRGHIGPAGLVPERHVERRGGRDRRATNFDLATAQVRGSGGGEPQAWPEGGQDRLSWLLQLAAVLQADATLGRPGAEILLPVLGPRGPAAAWRFSVRGLEALTLADGRQAQGLVLRRAAQHPYDLDVEVWLDPDDHHLPLQLRLTAPPGRWESIWLLKPAS